MEKIMTKRRRFPTLRRRALTVVLALSAAMGITVLAAAGAQAHGSPTSPGSRTYLCYQDGLLAGGDLKPQNAECAKAVATGGTQPLYDWFAVLRSDGAGRTRGFIPDGRLCGGGTDKYAPYDTPAADWPATRLTSGANWTFHYNAWAAHPGQFRLYITKDSYDPTKALSWDDLEDTPFSTWDETVPNGNGEYFWDVKLPANKTGRHIIYSVWQRSDSQETFYGCSDVVFDGGNGQVIGIPGYGGQPVATDTPTATTNPTATTGPTATATASTGPTASTTTTAPPSGSSCTAQVNVNAWPGGYQGSVTVLNNGAALTPWTVTFTVPSGVTLQSGWNADVTQAGTTITAVAPSWNRTIGAAAQVNVGFVANGPATPAPNAVKLNGAACGGSGATPTSTTTTTAPPTTAPPTTAPPTTAPPTTAMPSGMDMGCTDSATASLICDGFEGQTSGAAPTMHWSVVQPDCSGTGKAVVDTSVVHSGSASLRVDGAAGYCNHVFVQSEHRLDTGGPIYVRAYIRHSTPLPTSHVTMIAMSDANDGGKDLRIGGQNGALQWNRSSDDATLPEQSPVGVGLSTALPNTGWQCLEYKIDGNAGTAQTWLNGKEVVGLTADGVATQDIDRQWYSKTWKPLVTNLKLGWESYGEGSDTIWYDDVAAGSSRIGC
jgi:predicted carbohydrate-binding protein with CBM5 and CBM33 domain